MLTQENFKPVTLADRAFFERHYAQYPQAHSDNTFTNMVCWNHYAHYQYAYVQKISSLQAPLMMSPGFVPRLVLGIPHSFYR
jgi:hypothetical protein